VTEKIISIHKYQRYFKKKLTNYQLAEGQDAFTLHPLEALELCKEDHERHPFVVTVRNRIVGFFVIHFGEETHNISKNENAVVLRAFSIDIRDQGKGFAKQALDRLPDLVLEHFPTVNEIVLCVNQRNSRARKLYDVFGFISMGETIDGRSGLQDVLHFAVRRKK
jgi:RimJ/RimL family protein N-acetyltransferase